MAFSEVLQGRRHIRFTRTVRREVNGSSLVADIWIEGYFPPDFVPERYEIDLVKAKDSGVVTVALNPDLPLDAVVEILDAGATVVAIGAPETETSRLDLAAELDGTLSQDRADQIKLEMARLQANPDLAVPAAGGKTALLAGAAVKPLRRF